MSETTEFWKGSFGSEYLQRNRVKWEDRIPFWQHIVDETGAASFLDVGCNAGWNMMALRRLDEKYEMSGVDVNMDALREAQAHGFDVQEGRADQVADMFGAGVAELTVTSGVLIHISPADLPAVMKAIVDVTARYVLAIEYPAETETEVEYRGHKGRLWKRPFGKLYEELGLSLIETGPAIGFVDCHYWLLEKA